MTLFNTFKRKEKSYPVKKKDIQLQEREFVIDERLKNLLWIRKDGRYNFVPESMEYINSTLSIIFPKMKYDDPSVINLDLPIKKTEDVNSKLDYYPSYEKLTPEQRYIYLKWLENIEKDINIDYVFILYYALERHLMFYNYEKAREVILTLKTCHNHSSFKYYSDIALVIAGFMHENYVDAHTFLNQEKWSDLHFFVAKQLNVNLTAETIINSSSSFNFKNKRYIQSNPKLFRDELVKLIQDKYSNDYISLDKFSFQGTTIFPMTANYSLDNAVREISIPSLLSNNDFVTEINSLLCETHEIVKLKSRKSHN